MSTMKHPVTGHQISTDEQSVEFWQAAGYRSEEKPKAAAKKAAPRKSRSSKK